MPHPLLSFPAPGMPTTSDTTQAVPSVPTQTRSPAARRMIAVENEGRGLFMGGNVRPLAKVGDTDPLRSTDPYTAPVAFRPATPDQMAALRFLRKQPLPLKPKRIARTAGWSLSKAKGWLAFFSSKGVLVATGAGHVWRST